MTGFALRLVLTSHAAIPRQGELDSLADAETAFVPAPPKKSTKGKKATAPAPMKGEKKPVALETPVKNASRRKAA